MADKKPLIGEQFRGLPMGGLIGGPLNAARDAQDAMAKATADFLAKAASAQPPSEAPDQDSDA